jgi:hypothetical protein
LSANFSYTLQRQGVTKMNSVKWSRAVIKNNKIYMKFLKPLKKILVDITPVESRGNRPFQMTMEQFLDILIYQHLTTPVSGRHLIQELKQDSFARQMIAPPDGINKSSFCEAMHSRNLEFFIQVFTALTDRASSVLPKEYGDLGDLIAIDGTFIDATLSMLWADYYNKDLKKAKAHVGFDLNRSIPSKITLTSGKGDERKEVKFLLFPGQTGVTDRYYQYHKYFDLWQSQGIHFVCRIREGTTKTIRKENPLISGSIVFYDAIVRLGSTKDTYTQKDVRVIGYKVGTKVYWVATDRLDLSAEQIANIYHLRWKIEIFFGWWKRHFNVYHLLSRSWHGLMIQLLAGLITYLLLAIYCRESFQEKVSIFRVRELWIAIRNETILSFPIHSLLYKRYFLAPIQLYAKT